MRAHLPLFANLNKYSPLNGNETPIPVPVLRTTLFAYVHRNHPHPHFNGNCATEINQEIPWKLPIILIKHRDRH